MIEKTFSWRRRVKTLQWYRFKEISINKTWCAGVGWSYTPVSPFISMMATFLSLSLIVVNLSVKCGSFFTDIHRLDIAHWNFCGHGNSFFVDIVIKSFVRIYTHTHSHIRTYIDVEKKVWNCLYKHICVWRCDVNIEINLLFRVYFGVKRNVCLFYNLCVCVWHSMVYNIFIIIGMYTDVPKVTRKKYVNVMVGGSTINWRIGNAPELYQLWYDIWQVTYS